MSSDNCILLNQFLLALIQETSISFGTFTASLGGIDRFTKEMGEVFAAVKSAIYHERYNENMVWNDIGLLILAEPVGLSKE